MLIFRIKLKSTGETVAECYELMQAIRTWQSLENSGYNVLLEQLPASPQRASAR